VIATQRDPYLLCATCSDSVSVEKGSGPSTVGPVRDALMACTPSMELVFHVDVTLEELSQPPAVLMEHVSVLLGLLLTSATNVRRVTTSETRM